MGIVYNRADLESIHKQSTRHRDKVMASKACGCFYCEAVFAPGEITEWIDPPSDDESDEENGTTALCPRCGIDSVIHDGIPGVPISATLLAEMRAYWFERTVPL
jgi:hypothetical protein